MPTPLETYLTELHHTRSSGLAVKETSFYPALSNLLNTLGSQIAPRVSCVINLQNRGAGIPDGGFFTKDQLRRDTDTPPDFAQTLPSRGVMEVKGTADDARKIAASPQVRKYLDLYGLVLVTNLREFLLVGADPQGAPTLLESFALAPDEKSFWALAARPTADLAEPFQQYLLRVLLHAAPLREPKQLAWFLASYARDAKTRLHAARDLPELAVVRSALEEALGIRFEGPKGQAFFESTLIQTLFYGIFSAWVLRHETEPDRPFDWRLAGWQLQVPMIRELFSRVAQPASLGKLQLVEVLDWAAAALNRVDAVPFFERFERDDAVQYFYEPFLEAFDPALRKELGVWYTPREVVQYMVYRVDEALRTELQITRGLADPRVIVLDPCCGTGAFLVETAKLIRQRLHDEGADAFAADDLKEALTRRIFGFEIMPAPFVVAHLQLGLLLQRWQAALDPARQERVGVYLTNALTGWEPARQPKQLVAFPELQEERDAAGAVKLQQPILVVLGNPPYNAFAGVGIGEEQDLVKPYKTGLQTEWGIKKFNLDELYVRFFRLAERRIAEQTGEGVVCFISNFSYLREPSFVVMRQRLLNGFDGIWVDNLNGDSRETGKRTPDGKPDPSVFSTPQNKEGIQKGTAIGLFVRQRDHQPATAVQFRHFWGKDKRAELLAATPDTYAPTVPEKENKFSFYPIDLAINYMSWPKLTELCEAEPLNGMMEKRRGSLFSIGREALAERMKTYLDPTISWEELKAMNIGLTLDAARFGAKDARDKAIRVEKFDLQKLLPYAMRPFDNQWCYYTATRPLWNEPRPQLFEQIKGGNLCLITRMQKSKDMDGVPILITESLFDDGFLNLHAVAIPFKIKKLNANAGTLFAHEESETETANLSTLARQYLSTLGLPNPDTDADTAALVWYHALAVGYSPAYLAENADGIGQDFPRVPLPASAAALRASAALGRQVAALLLPSATVPGITEQPSEAIRCIAEIVFLENDNRDLEVRANWGYRTDDGKVMPGSGRTVERSYTSAELAALGEGAEAVFGVTTFDVFLNDTTLLRNVPAAVWHYYIGGYQVMKKWLSYREGKVLGRSLTKEEVRELVNTARRLAALCQLANALDANYRAVAG